MTIIRIHSKPPKSAHANFEITSRLVHTAFLLEPVAFVEFDKFQEGDIITFKEGIPREVSCTAFQSIPAADVSFKVGDKTQPDVKLKSDVCIPNTINIFFNYKIYKYEFINNIKTKYPLQQQLIKHQYYSFFQGTCS